MPSAGSSSDLHTSIQAMFQQVGVQLMRVLHACIVIKLCLHFALQMEQPSATDLVSGLKSVLWDTHQQDANVSVFLLRCICFFVCVSHMFASIAGIHAEIVRFVTTCCQRFVSWHTRKANPGVSAYCFADPFIRLEASVHRMFLCATQHCAPHQQYSD